MGMQGNEAEVFFRMRQLMFELVPLVKEAANFPNPLYGHRANILSENRW